jgi:hypothetical protein
MLGEFVNEINNYTDDNDLYTDDSYDNELNDEMNIKEIINTIKKNVICLQCCYLNFKRMNFIFFETFLMNKPYLILNNKLHHNKIHNK